MGGGREVKEKRTRQRLFRSKSHSRRQTLEMSGIGGVLAISLLKGRTWGRRAQIGRMGRHLLYSHAVGSDSRRHGVDGSRPGI